MEIIRLEEKNQYYDTIVDWMYHWWGIRDGKSIEEVKENIAHCLHTGLRLPQTYIALIDQHIAGVYMISMMDDLESRPDVYPWIINVYVDEKYRHLHVCKEMMESVNDIFINEKMIFFIVHFSFLLLFYSVALQFLCSCFLIH